MELKDLRQLSHELFLAFVEYAQHKEACAIQRHGQHSRGLACTCGLIENTERLRDQVHSHLDTEDIRP